MSLFNLGTTLSCILSFVGFLRFSEVNKFEISDIVSKETHMPIFIGQSKTDICQEGYLSKLKSCLCPLKLFR